MQTGEKARVKTARGVKFGDEVSLSASLLRTGRTSIQIHVWAWRRSRASDDGEKVTEVTFTFVALAGEGVHAQTSALDGCPGQAL